MESEGLNTAEKETGSISEAPKTDPILYACKVVERGGLCNTKENLIVMEIQNQDSINS